MSGNPPSSDLPELAGAAPRRERPRIATLLRAVFLMLVLAGAAYWVYRERVQVAEALTRVSAPSLAIAFAATAFGLWTGAPAWRTVLGGLGSRLSALEANRIFLVGQLGKYIPGGVWTVVAHASLGREISVPRLRTAAASLLTITLTVVTAALLGAVLLVVSDPSSLSRHWWVVALVVPLAVTLHPSVLVIATRWAARVLKRPMPLTRMGQSQVARAAGWLSAGHIANGLAVYALAASIAPTRPSAILVIGLTSLAVAAGLVVVFAPAGAGVRELVIVLGLAPYLDTGAALLVVILARLVAIAADFTLAGVFVRTTLAKAPQSGKGS